MPSDEAVSDETPADEATSDETPADAPAASRQHALWQSAGTVIARIEALLDDQTVTDEAAVTELNEIREELAGYVETLEAEDPVLSEMKEQLADAQADYEAVAQQLDEKLQTIDDLNGQIETLNAQSETDAEQLSDLQQQLAEAEAEVQTHQEAMEQSRQAYEKQLAEVEAYRLDRAPVDGEAHAATSVGNVLRVAADGVTASWHFENTAISSNPVVLRLESEGQTVYTSQPLAPGQVIDSLTLNTPLSQGIHTGMAVSSITDENGELLYANRVPVTIEVE